MRSKLILLFCMFFSTMTGCKAEIVPNPDVSPDPQTILREELTTTNPPPISQTSQIEPQTQLLIQATPSEHEQNEIPRDEVHLPVFLEIVQTTKVGKSDRQGPFISVGPPVYFYEQQSKVLFLDPEITLEFETQLLIGFVQTLQTSDSAYDKKEIIQYPPAQQAPVQVVAHDLNSGTVTIIFANETLDLMPGEQRTLKQQGAGSNSPEVITKISNYGQLAEIQVVFFDGAQR